MIQQSTYIGKHTTEVVRGTMRNLVSSSIVVIFGSCAPLEIFPHHQLNTDRVLQIQNNPLPFQSVHEILSGKSRIIKENNLGGLLDGLDDSTEEPEEYVDDNGKVFTREQLESSDE